MWCDVWKFVMFKKFIPSQLFKPSFFVPEPLWNSNKEKLLNFRIDFFYRSVIDPITFCNKIMFTTVYFLLLNEKYRF